MTGPWAPLDETKRAMLRTVVRANIKCFISRLLRLRPCPLDGGVEELEDRLALLRYDLRRRRRQQLPVALRGHPQAGRNLGNALLDGDDRLQWRRHPVARRGQITQVVAPAASMWRSGMTRNISSPGITPSDWRVRKNSVRYAR